MALNYFCSSLLFFLNAYYLSNTITRPITCQLLINISIISAFWSTEAVHSTDHELALFIPSKKVARWNEMSCG